jgi:hypothetical protein
LSRLRAFLATPLSEQAVAFQLVVAAAVIAAIVVVLVALAGGGDGGEKDHGSLITTEAPGDERPSLIDPTQLARVRETAQRFARGYAAVLYGRGRVSAIERATAKLRREVEREIVRVPPTRTELHPRILRVRVTAQSAARAIATATVDDGAAPRYPVVFFVDARAGGWVVTRLAND